MAKLTQNPLARFGALPSADFVPDLLQPGLAVVFCGTALGLRSAQDRAYYANPGNFFWRTLHATGLTPHRLAPQDYAQATQYGIGLTDLCKTAYGNDTDLPGDAFDIEGLRRKIAQYQPRYLAFTSKTAAAAMIDRPTGRIPYGLQDERLGNTQLFVLPSPSGQARVFWDQTVWHALADAVRSNRE